MIRVLTLNPDPRFAYRATESGRELCETYSRADGSRYDVPLYRPRAGVSADKAARALGGRIPARRDRAKIERKGAVLAAVSKGGKTYPVVHSDEVSLPEVPDPLPEAPESCPSCGARSRRVDGGTHWCGACRAVWSLSGAQVGPDEVGPFLRAELNNVLVPLRVRARDLERRGRATGAEVAELLADLRVAVDRLQAVPKTLAPAGPDRAPALLSRVLELLDERAAAEVSALEARLADAEHAEDQARGDCQFGVVRSAAEDPAEALVRSVREADEARADLQRARERHAADRAAEVARWSGGVP